MASTLIPQRGEICAPTGGDTLPCGAGLFWQATRLNAKGMIFIFLWVSRPDGKPSINHFFRTWVEALAAFRLRKITIVRSFFAVFCSLFCICRFLHLFLVFLFAGVSSLSFLFLDSAKCRNPFELYYLKSERG
jgi:hypothetical protein